MSWTMHGDSTHAFTLDNGEPQLRVAFDSVTCMRPHNVSPKPQAQKEPGSPRRT